MMDTIPDTSGSMTSLADSREALYKLKIPSVTLTATPNDDVYLDKL
jgi:hypothetical protein